LEAIKEYLTLSFSDTITGEADTSEAFELASDTAYTLYFCMNHLHMTREQALHLPYKEFLQYLRIRVKELNPEKNVSFDDSVMSEAVSKVISKI
jgi:hypothetical protein